MIHNYYPSSEQQYYWNPQKNISKNLPYNSTYFYPYSKSPTYLDTQKIKNVLEQINTIFKHLLHDLNEIYVANQIQYDVKDYLKILTRLLTPFQLIYNIDNFDKNNVNPEVFRVQIKKQHKYKNIPQITIPNPHPKQDLKLIPEYNQPIKIQQKLSHKKANKRYYYRDRTRPLLKQQLQTELVDWTLRKLSQNKKVRRKDIAQKAYQLNNGQNQFSGSMGWVNRFLQRHPQVRFELKKIAKTNVGIRNGDHLDSSSDLNEQQIKQLLNCKLQGKYQQNYKQSMLNQPIQSQQKRLQSRFNHKNQINNYKQEQQISQQNKILHRQLKNCEQFQYKIKSSYNQQIQNLQQQQHKFYKKKKKQKF